MENLELIRNIRLFKELDEPELKKFLGIAVEQKFSAGTIIIEENTEGKALFVIKSGTVVVSKIDGSLESEIVKLFAGEHFGEMSLVEDAKTSRAGKRLQRCGLHCHPEGGIPKTGQLQFQDRRGSLQGFHADSVRPAKTDLPGSGGLETRVLKIAPYSGVRN